MGGKTWPVMFAVLLVVSWSVSGDRRVRPSQDSAEVGEIGREHLPARVDEEVLIGEYECRADAGTSVNVTAIFSSTGDLVPPHTQSVTRDGGIVLTFAPLEVVSQIFGDATVARCELLASELEDQLNETACTVGNRDGHSVPGMSVGFTFACQGSRPRLVDVIGEVGRSVLGATL